MVSHFCIWSILQGAQSEVAAFKGLFSPKEKQQQPHVIVTEGLQMLLSRKNKEPGQAMEKRSSLLRTYI